MKQHRFFILITAEGGTVGEFRVEMEYLDIPAVIVWQTRTFQRSHHVVEGDVYEEVRSYFMPPQCEVKP